MAKGICPVKPEYLRKIQERKLQEVVTGAGSGVDVTEAQPKSKSKHRQVRWVHGCASCLCQGPWASRRCNKGSTLVSSGVLDHSCSLTAASS